LKLFQHKKKDFRVLFFLHIKDVETSGLELIVLAESTPCGVEFQLSCSTEQWHGQFVVLNLFIAFFFCVFCFLGWCVDVWSLVLTFQLKFEKTFTSSSRI
jgi:hypothetical protein